MFKTAARGVLLLAVVTGGCVKAPASPPVSVEPIHVKAQKEGDDLRIEAYDASTLFERGGDDLRSDRCASAIKSYSLLLSEFPTSELAAPTLYNMALCLSDLGENDQAAQRYLELIDRFPGSPDVSDALFQLGGCYEKLERFEEVVKTFDRLLYEREDLEGIERVEALARKGSALLSLGRDAQARLPLEEAVAIFRSRRGISPSDSVFHYSMAQFKLAEILHNEMRAVVLPADETILEEYLDKKARLLLDAQRLYTKVIRIGHAHWASAAAYRIGALYHHLWEDMLDAPPPEDLDAEAQEIYFEILRDRIRVLLEKAVVQWERTIKLAVRLNLDNEWIDSATEDLEKIRDVLELEAPKK